jgi:misacylated tRNA(Ala) deacylase
MKPNEGRLQTGEHILARIIQDKIPDTKVVIAKFDKENEGSVDFSTITDLRQLNKEEIEKEVNQIISKNFEVTKTIYKRKDIEKDFDLSKIPQSVNEVRIVEIKGFDKRPCKDPHVKNTNEIGCFEILKIERAGKDRYKIIFCIREE